MYTDRLIPILVLAYVVLFGYPLVNGAVPASPGMSTLTPKVEQELDPVARATFFYNTMRDDLTAGEISSSYSWVYGWEILKIIEENKITWENLPFSEEDFQSLMLEAVIKHTGFLINRLGVDVCFEENCSSLLDIIREQFELGNLTWTDLPFSEDEILSLMPKQ